MHTLRLQVTYPRLPDDRTKVSRPIGEMA